MIAVFAITFVCDIRVVFSIFIFYIYTHTSILKYIFVLKIFLSDYNQGFANNYTLEQTKQEIKLNKQTNNNKKKRKEKREVLNQNNYADHYFVVP